MPFTAAAARLRYPVSGRVAQPVPLFREIAGTRWSRIHRPGSFRRRRGESSARASQPPVGPLALARWTDRTRHAVRRDIEFPGGAVLPPGMRRYALAESLRQGNRNPPRNGWRRCRFGRSCACPATAPHRSPSRSLRSRQTSAESTLVRIPGQFSGRCRDTRSTERLGSTGRSSVPLTSSWRKTRSCSASTTSSPSKILNRQSSAAPRWRFPTRRLARISWGGFEDFQMVARALRKQVVGPLLPEPGLRRCTGSRAGRSTEGVDT